jgi:PKD repeat protein
MDPFLNCYCTSNATSAFDSKIAEFEFDGTVFTSPSTSCETYTDNTSQPLLAFQGSNADVRVRLGTCGGNFTRSFKVWVDFNQNGTYDANEEVFSGGPSNVTGTDFTGSFPIPANALTGTTGMRVVLVETSNLAGISSCGTYTWGETEDYLLTILAPPANDAGIASIDTPNSPACAVAGNLHVTLSNLGTDTLSSATINWSVNGTLQTPVTWTGAVAPTSVDTVPSFVANFAFVVGDSIAVWTTLPNGVQDSISLNDTLTYVVPPVSLNGTYTIDANGAGPTNYVDFTSAVADLNNVGVCGPVVFNVANGTYTEQVVINQVPGSSSTNTITFKSTSGDTSLCEVNFGVSSTAANYVLNIGNGASHIHFEDIKFRANGPSAFTNRVVQFDGNNSSVSFDGCRIQSVVTTTTGTNVALVWKDNTYGEGLSFTNNSFYGGSFGVYLEGSTATNDDGLMVSGNTFEEQYYTGIWSRYQNNPKVHYNSCTSNSNVTFGYGAYLSDFAGDGVEVIGNHIYSGTGNWPEDGLYMFNITGDFNDFAKITGNAVSLNNNVGDYAFYLSNGLFVDIQNNSFFMNSNSTGFPTTRAALYTTGGAVVRMVNNALRSADQGPAVYINTPSAVFESDNNAFSAAGNIAFWSGGQADLAALQAANGKDANSVEVSNIFSDTMNLLVCNDTLDGAGAPNANYMMDVQGDPVDPNAVDIGADQFATAATFRVADTVGICAPGDTATIEAWYFDSISWNNGAGQGNYFDVTTPGVVVVEAFGICGQAADTITVIQAIPVDLPATSVICTDSVGMIDAGISGGTYAWSNGATTQSVMVTTPGTYSVTVTDKDGCVSDDQTTANLSTPVDLAMETPLCDGNPATLDAGIANGTYSWTTGDATQITTANAAGTYGVTVTDADGCVSEDETTVIEVTSPVADFTSLSSYYTVSFTNGSQNGDSYFWDFGDGETSTSMSPTHLYDYTNDSSITYTVTLIVTNVCGSDTATYEVAVGNSVGLNELANGAAYEVFPNPNAGQFNIVLNNTGNQEVGYMVVDVQGKVVTQRNIGAVSNAHQERVDVTDVAPGIYFLRMTIGDETTVERIAIR